MFEHKQSVCCGQCKQWHKTEERAKSSLSRRKIAGRGHTLAAGQISGILHTAGSIKAELLENCKGGPHPLWCNVMELHNYHVTLTICHHTLNYSKQRRYRSTHAAVPLGICT